MTITLPDSGKRFMSLQVIDEDQYAIAVVYGAGSYTLLREKVGTRYVMVAVRTLVDPADPADFSRVHALQNAIRVKQKNPGRFEVPEWDQASHKKVHDALVVLGETIADSHHMFGPRSKVDPIRHLIGTAMAWGGNPETDATYLLVTPPQNDGTTVHRLTVKDVPVDGFWSISVYNAQGYFEKNAQDAYTINNLTADGSDGAITVQFGGTNTDPRSTGCRSRRAGTTPSGSIDHAPNPRCDCGLFRRPCRRRLAARGRCADTPCRGACKDRDYRE